MRRAPSDAQKDFRSSSPLEILFQHGFMGQEARIIKIFGMLRTVDDAGLALDTDTGHFLRMFPADGSHGTDISALAAVIAPGQIRPGFGLEEFGRLPILSFGDIIRSHRRASLDESFRANAFFEQCRGPGNQFRQKCFVCFGRMLHPDIRKGMPRGESSGRKDVEAMAAEFQGQFRQGTVIAAVAKSHKRCRRGVMSLEQLLDKGKCLVGDPPGICGHAKNDQRFRAIRADGLLPPRQSEIIMADRDAQGLRQALPGFRGSAPGAPRLP